MSKSLEKLESGFKELSLLIESGNKVIGKIKVTAKFVRESDDYGCVYEITCPDCSLTIRISEGPGNDCDCRDWSLNLMTATGIYKD